VHSEDVARYRLYAANCIESAEHVPDADRRVFLLRMAQAWIKLAEQVERNGEADPDDEDPEPRSDPEHS
jgi:hypothetical protein